MDIVLKYLAEAIITILFGILAYLGSRKMDELTNTQKDHSKRIEENSKDIAVNTANDENRKREFVSFEKIIGENITNLNNKMDLVLGKISDIEKDLSFLHGKDHK